MTLFMETTQIGAEKTLGEIQAVLGRYGANQIILQYKDREVTAIAFKYTVNGDEVPFLLPCRWEAVQKILDKKNPPKERYYRGEQIKYDNVAQAKRIAWRQILRWVQAQLALVETEMVKIEEVFMPYIQIRGGRTIFEAIEKKGFAALEFKN